MDIDGCSFKSTQVHGMTIGKKSMDITTGTTKIGQFFIAKKKGDHTSMDSEVG